RLAVPGIQVAITVPTGPIALLDFSCAPIIWRSDLTTFYPPVARSLFLLKSFPSWSLRRQNRVTLPLRHGGREWQGHSRITVLKPITLGAFDDDDPSGEPKRFPSLLSIDAGEGPRGGFPP